MTVAVSPVVDVPLDGVSVSSGTNHSWVIGEDSTTPQPNGVDADSVIGVVLVLVKLNCTSPWPFVDFGLAASGVTPSRVTGTPAGA